MRINTRTWKPIGIVASILATILVATKLEAAERSCDPTNSALAGSGFWNLSPDNLTWDAAVPPAGGNVNVTWPTSGTTARFDIAAGQTITVNQGGPVPVNGLHIS